jgi:hypothetical protein
MKMAGGERGFNVEFHALEAEFDKISGVIAQISAGLGPFQPLGAGRAVAYAGGNVGIGASFSPTNPPAYRLEVNLDANTATTERVRFGHAVCSNGGAGAFAGYAVFSHDNQASDSSCALRQGPNGNVHINAATGQPVSIRQSGSNVRLGVSAAGNVVVGSETDLAVAPPTAALQVVGDAFKNTGSGSWLIRGSRKTCASWKPGSPSCGECGRFASATTAGPVPQRGKRASVCSARKSRKSFPR